MNIPVAITKIAPDGQITPAAKRQILIEMCRRRIKPGTGSGREFLRRRTAMLHWPDLQPILKGIPWIIVGGVATRAYMPERQTRALDILVHDHDSELVMKKLEASGYVRVSPLAISGYLFHSPEGIEIDLIFGKYSWMDEAMAHPRKDQAGYPVLDLPYLILMKTEVSRTQDLGDVSRMLGLASEEELSRVRTIVKRYAPDLADDIESLIYLGQLEMKEVS